MTEKIASIIYEPRCSKCGAVIREQVECQIIPYRKSEKFPCVLTDYKITPNQCPSCGAYFGSIIENRPTIKVV